MKKNQSYLTSLRGAIAPIAPPLDPPLGYTGGERGIERPSASYFRLLERPNPSMHADALPHP